MAGPLTGQRGGFRQPSRWGRNESGNFDTWIYHGSRAEVNRLAATFAQVQGLSYDVDENFGANRLTVYFPWNTRGIDPTTDLIVRWEFFAQQVEKDLLSARVENAATIAMLTPQQVSTIRQKLINPPDDGDNGPYPTAADFQKHGESLASGQNALAIFNLMMQGVTSFPVEAPTLRRTFITSIQYAIAYSLTNVRKIISTNSLVTSESLPTSLVSGVMSAIALDTWVDPIPANPNAPTPPTFAFGWRKKFPTIQQVALLKWQIVQEWDYGLWATLLWGNPL